MSEVEWVDTHNHLQVDIFDKDVDALWERAKSLGVTDAVITAGSAADWSRVVLRARKLQIHYTLGIHPLYVDQSKDEDLNLLWDRLNEALDDPLFVGIGEIGLDYYWDDRFKAEQLEAFTKQCRLAATYDLPVAIHTRAAWKDMCRTVETETKAAREKGLRLRGVFHAFAEDADTYRQLKECGDFLFGIGGVVTFKKSRLADTVREMELDDLVLETDCPYLTPVPYRGQRNESGYIPYICNKIAALKGTTPEEVAAATTRNARRMFGFDAARQTTNDHSSPTESI